MTISRFIMIFVIDKVGFHRLFVITCFGQTLTLGLFAMSSTYIISLFAIFLTGIMMGGIFSLGLLVVNDGIPGLEDRTTSLMLALGGLGGALLPRLIGGIMDHYPIQVTLYTLFTFSIILTYVRIIIKCSRNCCN